jgi:serine/threonine-protein kinase
MELAVRPGHVLAGKYRVERTLGSGGMGVVVAARHTVLDQRVALKFMKSGMVSDPDATDRFLREARAVVRLRGEHVARVFDVGQLDDGAPYIVMEYLEGRDLGAVLARGVLPVTDAVDHILDACVGVAEAHASGIIHRDLKPQNLFLTRRPDGSSLVKVLDFGVSKAPVAEGVAGRPTVSSAMMGSPLYMAPEQMRSARDVDERADVWAIGVILYELMSGALPFVGESVAVVCAKVLGEPPRPLADAAPRLPVELCRVVERCLRKAPEERYPHVADLGEALVPYATERGRAAAQSIRSIVARPRTLEEPPPLDVSSTVSTLGRTTRRQASGEVRAGGARLKWTGLVLASVAAAALLVIGAVRRGRPPEREEIATPRAQPAPTPVVTPLIPDAGAPAAAEPAPPTPVRPTAHGKSERRPAAPVVTPPTPPPPAAPVPEPPRAAEKKDPDPFGTMR